MVETGLHETLDVAKGVRRFTRQLFINPQTPCDNVLCHHFGYNFSVQGFHG